MSLRNHIKQILQEFKGIEKRIGCDKFAPRSVDKALCKTLKQRKYSRLFTPIVQRILKSKKKKWNEVIPKVEQDKIFNVLYRLKELDPNRKWKFPSTSEGESMYGTIDEFINNRLSELSFIYDMDSEGTYSWNQINKLDTNYTDSVVFFIDIIKLSKTFTTEKIYNEIKNDNQTTLLKLLDKMSQFPDEVYNKMNQYSHRYTIASTHYSKQGEQVEQLIMETLEKDGWKLIHRGGDGDPIDVLLGIDLIMEKNGKLKTIQCKKVWDINHVPSTLMNPNKGAYRVTGRTYVSKQINLDYVAYGTLNGEVIVAKKQKEVIKKDSQYVYTDKMSLPTPPSTGGYFYIDDDSVISKSENINEIKPRT